MSYATEIAKRLSCIVRNVYQLLRTRKTKGTLTASGRVVLDQALQEYLSRPKPKLHPIKSYCIQESAGGKMYRSIMPTSCWIGGRLHCNPDSQGRKIFLAN